MLDILWDTLGDSLKLLPFLFCAFLLIEYIENKLNNKSKKIITSSKKAGPIVGALLGAIPQCGFASIATNLYVTRIISLGTLISIYLSTSDEMLPILISHQVSLKVIMSFLAIKVIVGLLAGLLIDFFYHARKQVHFDLCAEEHCECSESIIKSSLKHTFKIFIFIFLILLGINFLMEYVDKEILSSIFVKHKSISPLLASIFGLIPSCASSVVLTEFYLNGIISFGTAIAGLLTNSGVSLLILFRTNKNYRENLAILGLITAIGTIVGIIFNLI